MMSAEFMVQVGAQGPAIAQEEASAAADVSASIMPAFRSLPPPTMADVIGRLLAEYLATGGRIRSLERLSATCGELVSAAFGHVLVEAARLKQFAKEHENKDPHPMG
jgi:hypothetical protein